MSLWKEVQMITITEQMRKQLKISGAEQKIAYIPSREVLELNKTLHKPTSARYKNNK